MSNIIQLKNTREVCIFPHRVKHIICFQTGRHRIRQIFLKDTENKEKLICLRWDDGGDSRQGTCVVIQWRCRAPSSGDTTGSQHPVLPPSCRELPSPEPRRIQSPLQSPSTHVSGKHLSAEARMSCVSSVAAKTRQGCWSKERERAKCTCLRQTNYS